ncbi:MAG: histidine triad nucleotide-binding protein [Chthoniobacterales bacterium]
MTLFEKIIAREIPADIVLETDDAIAFRDIAPQAPVHILVVPKKLIPRIGQAEDSDALLLGKLLLTARDVAKKEGLIEGGFRVVINHGKNGGETVPHLHMHILGGRAMFWPPG